MLQIIDSLDVGGAERMAVNIANVFQDNQIDNVICVTRLNGAFHRLLDKNVPYYFLHKKNPLDLTAFINLLRIIARYKPTIIHAHSTSYLWAGLAKLFFRQIKLVWHDHRGVNMEGPNKSRPFLKLLSKKMSGIIVVNEDLKQRNLRQTSVPAERIRFIKNFPDVRMISDDNRSKNDVNILCLANLRPEKNHQMLLDVFARILSKFASKNIYLWLAGKAFDPQYQEKLIAYALELGIFDKVKFMGNVQDTTTLLSKAHIGVLTSNFEGLPVSLLEYGLAALPVVVTDVGYCREVLGNGEYGWLVPNHNADAFADTLQYVIENREESREKGKQLKQRIINEYGARRFLNDYLRFVRSLEN